ncbi:MAG: DUF928 domain-containing protein [Cyanothece sp. SIO1E1]|nr:DUF928 domain-containing protein [Cyanothece sp. SIO1E1]
MIWLKPLTRPLLLTSTLALVIYIVVVPLATEAKPVRRPGLVEKIRRIFSGRNRSIGLSPGRQSGGATRDRCPAVDKPLTALVPTTDDGLPFIEATIAEHPTFWFYVPYSHQPERWVEFVLIDEAEADVYYQTFQLAETPGIISVQLPDTATPLQLGKQYRWVLSVICDLDNRLVDVERSREVASSGDIAIDGWLKRVSLAADVQKQLDGAMNPIERAQVYAEGVLWHEALTTLAQFRLENPQFADAEGLWLDLLESVQLDDVVLEPLTTCCTVKK